jgi:hypothetical protein
MEDIEASSFEISSSYHENPGSEAAHEFNELAKVFDLCDYVFIGGRCFLTLSSHSFMRDSLDYFVGFLLSSCIS